MTDITELAQRNELLIANGQQTADLLRHLADNEIDSDYFAVVSECESYGKETDAELSITEFALRAAGYVDALVEALEKAQAAERRWHRVASRIHEQACESDVKIDELEAIRAAAEKLVRCKGRYHSEQNYRALAALFGVNTPDLPPLEHENVHYADAAEIEIAALRQRIAELESRTVTVKLTDINEYLAEVHDKTLNRALRLLAEGVRAGDVAAMRAASIKVEAE
ncbi:ead/Ea22-like family protein [Klebsiella pneumoniae]|uniref:ead/Ea22-like family protein n=1 Tax=Klebsiella pneumoniae TaxID=573 RepID=UPI0007CA27C2|nr:ead/Ea22-like family protein [Klebsiella pneumoniae]HDU3549453.1 ead/Ea22-like family protein [Klebsiella pneumoniae subsp. pneumoniae]EKS8533943.1 ead/Ea22-like family protein [Klebsiella pneumoniae]EKU5923071.1 ead/Ea22-like family protein [Klebsiella pneumoniae]EKU6755940.1 ead/Ea22-like family protein [Klebsiella pneumoniae]EKW8977504.1 ead/Ea22-like family protein [Klebsiella pneumoniae]